MPAAFSRPKRQNVAAFTREAGKTLARPRIVGWSVSCSRKEIAKPIEERGALSPPFRSDENLWRHAVESAVVQFCAGDLLGDVAEICLAPLSWGDDDRADITELAARRFVGEVRRGDRGVRRNAAGHVDFVNGGMRAKISPELGVAERESHAAFHDERLERGFVDRQQIFEQRVNLEQRCAAFGDQLIEGVERPDRADVAGAKHERNARPPIPRAIPRRRRFASGALREAARHPNLGAQAGVQETLTRLTREHLDGDSFAKAPAKRAWVEQRRAVPIDFAQGADIRVKRREHRPWAGHRLFAGQFGAFDAFGARRQIRPPASLTSRSGFAPLEQLDFARYGPHRPSCGARAQLAQRGVKRLSYECSPSTAPRTCR